MGGDRGGEGGQQGAAKAGWRRRRMTSSAGTEGYFENVITAGKKGGLSALLLAKTSQLRSAPGAICSNLSLAHG